jgi:HEAT repeat protein
MKKILRLTGIAFLGALALPLLSAQAPEPKISVAPLMAECSKKIISQKVDERRRAIHGYYTLANEVPAAVTALSLALRDTDAEVRFTAAKGLARIGRSAGDAVDPLVEVMEKDPDGTVRIEATVALGNIFWQGSNPGHASVGIPALIRAMEKNDETFVRRNACYAFRMIGPTGKDAAPALLKMAKNSVGDVHELACDSLQSVACPELRPMAATFLEEYEKADKHGFYFRGAILVVLAKIRAKDDEVVPLLVAALKDKKTHALHGAALFGVGEFGPKAKAAVPYLIELLELRIADEDRAFATKVGVLHALGAIGPDASAAIPALRTIAETKSLGRERQLRPAAQKALESIEKK